ncbi:MAG: hypothetical protein MUE95_15430, partial [Cyclobacteriaceae bacterium]|nr:hypothetical protein [Cyclobacteriaceae bacterium]
MKALAGILITVSVITHAQPYLRIAEEHFRIGQIAYSKGAYVEAAAHVSKAIAANPVYAEAYLARARAYEKLHEPERALMDYNLCLEILPDQYEVLFSRAVLRYELKLYPLAHDDFRQLLRLPHGETNTVYYKQSAHQPGTVEILTLHSSNKAQLYHYLGLIELAMNNCGRSIQLLDSAILLNNTDPDFYSNRALARQQCKDE